MKKILLFVFVGIFLISLISASDWESHPEDCPVEYNSVSCTGVQKQCGIQPSDVPYCFDVSTLSPPNSNDTSNAGDTYQASLNPGFVVDCQATDAGEPYCDNTQNFWCNRNVSCYSTEYRQTTCVADLWSNQSKTATSSSYCAGCRTNYNDCDTDTTPCEILNGASCGSGTGTYNGCIDNPGSGIAGNCTSATNLDCDDDDADANTETCNAGNGCEILIGGPCTVGTLSGTYDSVCAGALGSCLVSPQHHLTNETAGGSSTHANLRTEQWGVGDVANFSNSTEAVIINKNLDIITPGSITGITGFFTNLGSLLNRITFGWFTDLNTINLNVTANLDVLGNASFTGPFATSCLHCEDNETYFHGEGLFEGNVTAPNIEVMESLIVHGNSTCTGTATQCCDIMSMGLCGWTWSGQRGCRWRLFGGDCVNVTDAGATPCDEMSTATCEEQHVCSLTTGSAGFIIDGSGLTGNFSINTRGNITADNGWFTNLGSLLNKITGIYADEADITNINSTNLNVTGDTYLENGTVITRSDSNKEIGIAPDNGPIVINLA